MQLQRKYPPAALFRHLIIFSALTATAAPAAAQDTQPQPLPGPEIINSTLDMQANFFGPCILQDSGKLNCWPVVVQASLASRRFNVDFETLNDALNNDIAEFSLGLYGNHACAIGRESGVACVDNPQYDFDATDLENIPEPDAKYISLSKLDQSENICGIQSDNRTVCWGEDFAVKNVPDEALYLKQVDVRFDYACGVDLTDSLVCWGATIFESDLDQQFGNEDLSTLGAIKQIALGPYGACVIKSNDLVRCFGGISDYTEFMQGTPVKSIETGYIGGPALCYEDLEGLYDCAANTFITQTEIGFTSVLADSYTPRIVSAIGQIFQINEDNSFVRYYTYNTGATVTNLFPSAPEGLRREVYSQSALELFWQRPSDDNNGSDFVTGYEIYRNDELVDVVGQVTSYFDEGLDNAAGQRYSVRPIRGYIGGTASTIDGDGPPMNPKIAAPTNLNGTVYSTTALEIFYDRSEVPGSTYQITRNGSIIRAAIDGNSYFDSGLSPDTEYTYGVNRMVDGNQSGESFVTLKTRADTTSSTIVAKPKFTYGVRYSSSALELFWQRPPTSSNVVSYELSRNGVVVAETDGVSYFDDTATNDQEWDYSLIAVDRNGYRSATARVILGPGLLAFGSRD